LFVDKIGFYKHYRRQWSLITIKGHGCLCQQDGLKVNGDLSYLSQQLINQVHTTVDWLQFILYSFGKCTLSTTMI